VVRRREVGVVVDRDRVLPEPPGGLDADEDVPEGEARHHDLPAVHVQLARRQPPLLLDPLPQLLREPGEPAGVAPGVEPSGGPSELILGEELEVVSSGGDERVDQGVPLLGHTVHLVASLPHLPQQPDGARRGVEADGVADPRVLCRVVGEQHRHPLLPVRHPPQASEADREAGEALRALGVGLVEAQRSRDGRGGLHSLLEREGDGDDPAVELGYGHLPGGVERREPGV
jgi:hypothetical protein